MRFPQDTLEGRLAQDLRESSVALQRALNLLDEAYKTPRPRGPPIAMQPEKGGCSNVYVTLDELAQELRVTRRTLERMRERGEGPPVMRLGQRRLVVSRRAADAWLDERQAKAEAANVVIASE
jgi:hypothetical protein